MLARDKGEEGDVEDILIANIWLGISLDKGGLFPQKEPPSCTWGGISHMAWGLRQSGFSSPHSPPGRR